VSADRAHMSRIGRLGGKSSAGRRVGEPSSVGERATSAAPGTERAQEADRPGDASV
jgi:general stress protein YciG